jgi:glycolate oxidase
MLPASFIERAVAIVGPDFVKVDEAARTTYGEDALRRGHPADLVVLPQDTAEVAAVVRLCDEQRVPIVPRGAGTGYTGGAVPLRGGVVLSLERLNRILQIDEANLLAIVQPAVINGVLQEAVEHIGLFYPPDPASLDRSSIGGNVAECAGGPRAFKYGTTKRYVLGLEAVLPTGEIVRTGGKSVKNVVGYDLTQLLVGSEGTLAIITEVTLRLIPKPPAAATLRATFASIEAATAAVGGIIRARIVPVALELMDAMTLTALERYRNASLAPSGTQALLIVEVDGFPEAIREEIRQAAAACTSAGATDVRVAADEAERHEIWRLRRDLSFSLRTVATLKFNHDIVVPKGRIPELFALVARLRERHQVKIPAFGHVGDGNIHVNIMVDKDDPVEMARVPAAERELFEGVIALEGSISGEHGIGFSKAKYLPLELSPDVIALSKRIKQAFDPHGILNPGKIFTAETELPTYHSPEF